MTADAEPAQLISAAPPSTDKGSFRKNVLPAIIGNAFEFFDFTTYALFAVMIGKTFFPASDPQTSLLLSVGVFGVGFVTRPLGSIFIGAYADRVGRKPAMLLTVWLMGTGTSLIAVTPSYESIGLAAPIIVIFARLIQGAALGGEFGPTTAYLYEVAPERRRGIYTAWQSGSQGLATLVAAALGFFLSGILTTQELSEWGWRVPFVLGMGIVPVGIVLRRNMLETAQKQVRKETVGQGQLPRHAKRTAIRQLTLIVAICAQIGFGTISIYICTYMTTYALTTLKLAPGVAFASAMIVGVAVFAGSLIGGSLSDHFSRRSVIVLPRLALLLSVFPLFSYAVGAEDATGLFLLSAVIPFLAMISSGAALATIMQVLPAVRRSSTVAVCYALVVTLLGGTAQFAVTWLINVTGEALIPAYYLIFICAVSLITVPWLRVISQR
jgi:MFS family permease